MIAANPRPSFDAATAPSLPSEAAPGSGSNERGPACGGRNGFEVATPTSIAWIGLPLRLRRRPRPARSPLAQHRREPRASSTVCCWTAPSGPTAELCGYIPWPATSRRPSRSSSHSSAVVQDLAAARCTRRWADNEGGHRLGWSHTTRNRTQHLTAASIYQHTPDSPSTSSAGAADSSSAREPPLL
jgi:hypothetical protein